LVDGPELIHIIGVGLADVPFEVPVASDPAVTTWPAFKRTWCRAPRAVVPTPARRS